MTHIRIKLPDRARAHASASTDAARPHLNGGRVYRDGETTTLIVSDSYQLASLPVEVSGDEERIEALAKKPLFVPAAAMRDAGPGGEVVLHEDGLIEMFGHERKRSAGRRAVEHLYRVPELHQEPPDFPQVLAKHTPPADARTLQFGLNAELLIRLARALGATGKGWGGVKFTIDLSDMRIGNGTNTYQKPLFVQSLSHHDDRAGILMPVRIEI